MATQTINYKGACLKFSQKHRLRTHNRTYYLYYNSNNLVYVSNNSHLSTIAEGLKTSEEKRERSCQKKLGREFR